MARRKSPGRPWDLRLAIFDDPDHPRKVLSLVDEGHRGGLRFDVLDGDVERGRVKRLSIRPRRVEQERPAGLGIYVLPSSISRSPSEGPLPCRRGPPWRPPIRQGRGPSEG